MPNNDARNAFNDAQKLAADLRDAHAREQAIAEMLRALRDEQTEAVLNGELKQFRNEWTRIYGAYTAGRGGLSGSWRSNTAANRGHRTAANGSTSIAGSILPRFVNDGVC